MRKANYKTCFPPKTCLTHQAFLSLSPVSPDVSPGLTIWLFTWRGTSRAGTGSDPAKSKGGRLKRRRTKQNETNAVSRPVSWLNCPRAEWRGCVPAKACRFAPYWNPVPAGPLFGERRSEGCLLRGEYKIRWGGSLFDWDGLTNTHTHNKRQKEWMTCMYGAWCFGDMSRTADTLVLCRTVWGEHVCTVNVCDWQTGPPTR